MPKGLLLVMTDIPPELEEEFNRWYDEEHMPERLGIPGFLSARRFRVIEGTPQYLALYELEDVAVLESEPYRRLLDPSNWTPWTHRVRPEFRNLVRNVYVQIFPPDEVS